MGLLEKRNPKATWRSVLFKSVVSMGFGAAFFFLCFKEEYRRAWVIALPPWLLLCGLVGGLMEWQIPPDEDDVPPPDDAPEPPT